MRYDPNIIRTAPTEFQHQKYRGVDYLKRGYEPAIVKGVYPPWVHREMYKRNKEETIDDAFSIHASNQINEIYLVPSRIGNPLIGSKVTTHDCFKDFEHHRRKRPSQLLLESEMSVGISRAFTRGPFEQVPLRRHRGEIIM
jgi:hypothetical protein